MTKNNHNYINKLNLFVVLGECLPYYFDFNVCKVINSAFLVMVCASTFFTKQTYFSKCPDSSGAATGGTCPPNPCQMRVLGFAQIQSFFGGGNGIVFI